MHTSAAEGREYPSIPSGMHVCTTYPLCGILLASCVASGWHLVGIWLASGWHLVGICLALVWHRIGQSRIGLFSHSPFPTTPRFCKPGKFCYSPAHRWGCNWDYTPLLAYGGTMPLSCNETIAHTCDGHAVAHIGDPCDVSEAAVLDRWSHYICR